MNQFQKFYQEIYQDGKTLKESKKINFFAKSQRRPNSIAIIGGALGDEGKGRAADEITTKLLTNHSKLVTIAIMAELMLAIPSNLRILKW